ncbi:50S ribosomal protein L9 [Waddlia chondrophila 2032/99]|uniref:Large ribosomal subunit protein bL9 n=2 Tax=Waddlia chondrophila TaxID=71667 RepID=D6YVM4_WADCW|nr:50S ribosomal protein L9 [Waddlia chondrophila]ADI38185.1 50S ribosomal protein L9 [Waddlia chondrophila WSU 86-1044]CCB90314.1 50S ribosomal protein L9 [Waddlia chondrophila 2032/99]
MATQLLLIEDVEDLGRSGDVVSVKPGYARNFILPKGLGIIADKNALRMQARLQEERQKRAAEDRSEAEALAKVIEGATLTAVVKVDAEGHMYGSVASLDIVHLMQEQKSILIEKKNVQLKHPIKTTGVHQIPLRLKEGVEASFTLKVISEEGEQTAPAEETQEEPKE